MKICDKDLCYGCKACQNICPKNAISFKSDIYGKSIPVIDPRKCIDCGICKKICPVNTNFINQPDFKQLCYAAYAKDTISSKNCASGGISNAFCQYILENNGVVFGAAFDENINLKHIMVRDKADLEKLKGSKYVYSDIDFTFRQAKDMLDKGVNVLFTGTPCQIAGFNNFLQKPYPNLITVDLICHGAPPASYLSEYLNKQYPDKNYNNLTFRGEKDFYFELKYFSDIISQEPAKYDIYFSAFLSGLSYRDNCYTCKFASRNRISDITIGDFWGIDRSTLKKPYKGKISVVLINTQKGKAFFDNTRHLFYYEARSIAEAAKNNEQLEHPSNPPEPGRDIFLKNYPDKGFLGAVSLTKIYKNVKHNQKIRKLKSSFPYTMLKKFKNKLLSK